MTTNRITANRITANRITANRITANRITANRITANRLAVSGSADELLATPEGRELFEVIVSCALPDTITLVATVDGQEFNFSGQLGLTPDWLHHALDREGQGWISACLLAHVNARGVSVQISVRGPNRGLRTDADERERFPLQEGAFYGNVFVPLDQPIVWIACRGEAQAAGESGGLADRDCAEEDPTQPGLTQCGFTFAGDCARFTGTAPVDSGAACEHFSQHGEFYQRCHAEPIDDEHRRGVQDRGDADDRSHDNVFREVITSYVSP